MILSHDTTDTKIFRAVSNDQDKEALQSDIHNLEEWSRTWQLRFNSSKYSVMHLGNQRTPAEYTTDNIMLSTTTVEKDLGVYIDSDLKFRRRVAQTVLKENQILGLIKATNARQLSTQRTI